MADASIYKIIFNKEFISNPEDIPAYVLQHVSGPKEDKLSLTEYVIVNQEENKIKMIEKEEAEEFRDNIIGEYVEGVIMTPKYIRMLSDSNLLIRKIGLQLIYK